MADAPPEASPNIDFDWEERSFKLARGLWRRLWPKRQTAPTLSQHAAFVEADMGTFAALASIIAAAPLKIESSQGNGGLRGDVIILPAVIDVAPSPHGNREIYVVRVCITATMFLQRAILAPDTEPIRGALQTLQSVGRAVEALHQELPGFAARLAAASQHVLNARPDSQSLRGRQRRLELLRQAALDGQWPEEISAIDHELQSLSAKGPSSPPVVLWGELFESPMAMSGTTDQPSDENNHAPAISSEIDVRVAEHVRRKMLDEEQDFNPIIHTFEKIHTLDNHCGSMRHTDGSDDLQDQLDALEEIDMNEVIRGGAPAEALLRADLQLGGEIPDVARVEPGERGLAYDEWDARKARYRSDWCTVYPTPVTAREPAWGRGVVRARARQIDELERRLQCHRSRMNRENRHSDGEEIDLDAVVRARGAVHAGETGDERLYIRQQRRRRDFATTVLIDISLSTDSWIANKRVLDIARESVVVLGEVSDRLNDRLRVLAFASHTRNICRVWELHGWNDPWSSARDRLGLLRPQGYTRIGPAIRHATADLAQVPADKRLLLLVSDGKPTDYDRYEGRYGMADIRQALREAARLEIHAHALAIDSRAKGYLSATFGVGGWNVLADPQDLPRVMTEVYGRLTA